MKQRLTKIVRLVTMQKQVHRLAEWQLFDLQRREDKLRQDAEDLVASLNDEAALHGLFVDAMAKRLTSIGNETGAVAKAREAQVERVLAEGRKLRQVERVHDATALDARRAAEKVRLDEIVEVSLVRRGGADRRSADET